MRLFCFGYGYVAQFLTTHMREQGWHVAGTTRSAEKATEIGGFVLNNDTPLQGGGLTALEQATHVLISIPPDEQGMDAALRFHSDRLADKWIGYLSTTGVYGDWQGEWVDEDAPLRATEPRSVRRSNAEAIWRTQYGANIFRLAGIYGPGRNALKKIRSGTAQRVVKEGQYFSRIHVADIVQVLAAAIAQPSYAEIFNLCDDQPAPSHEVIAYGCNLLGVEPPPLVAFSEAQLSAMAKSFYASNRRVKNNKIKTALNVALRYPTYREGLASILHSKEGV